MRIEKNGQNNPVGQGTYGVVYKAKDKVTDAFVAMKVGLLIYLTAVFINPFSPLQRIRLEVEDDGIPSTTLREISVLRQLRHPNIVE